ncbi:hypothetical protein [Porphyrobacter sp. LM 6]|jgi:hypothetical protein|uniref:hypothetical protein n=1 Tax=Porphyrobacter sp. LM 6 TaxID=1896196 RepID=UPI00084773B4|nr:hypothetical protein [Porphyrobacter sp. LM 6]AOL93299.1 hypothetical protein BG023_11343 [Porphyrobacter sp. LM 6]
MATLPPEPILSHGDTAAAIGAGPAALAAAWEQLEGQAAQLALLARIAPEPSREASAITPLLASARTWQCQLAAQGIADIAAMLGSGLTALATLSRREQDTSAPALALWREFHAARTALIDVLKAVEPA